jgi:hypothetical protein
VEAYTRCGLQKSCGQLATETMWKATIGCIGDAAYWGP